jgi:hypothetical protein
MNTNVTGEGQVVTAKPFREGIGISPGEANGDAPASRFERLRGRAGPGPSTDEIMAMTRGVQ